MFAVLAEQLILEPFPLLEHVVVVDVVVVAAAAVAVIPFVHLSDAAAVDVVLTNNVAGVFVG